MTELTQANEVTRSKSFPWSFSYESRIWNKTMYYNKYHGQSKRHNWHLANVSI